MFKKACVALLTATILASPAHAGGRAGSTVQSCNPQPASRDLPACVRPKMRYWLPLGRVDVQAVRQDIARIARAGFGGVELISVPSDAGVSSDQGYDGVQWRLAVKAALAEAAKHGITVDLAMGPLYPAAVPSREIGSAASRELVFSQAPVNGRFNGPVPIPQGEKRPLLVGVSAMRVSRSDAASTTFDRTSVVDLTSKVAQGGLDWTPPSAGEWRIVASWSRETGHQITGAAPAPYAVVDHFSEAGTAKVIEQWKTDILPGLGADRSTLRDVFEDSLHLQGYSLWTEDLLSEFQRRRGYDLRPYLPALSIGHLNDFFFSIFNRRDITPRNKPDLDLSDGAGPKIRDDYYQTLTELYAERHLAPLERFFGTQGLKLRVQPSYGQSLEGTTPVAFVDVPETESFQLDDSVEAYRVQAGAVHVLGKPVYSAECCATQGAAGKTDWNDALKHIGGLFAGGVNQIVFHGFAQTTPHESGKAAWMPFGGMFSEDYGRIAAWPDASAVTAKLARQQAVLRAGQPEIDLAILRHSYWDNGHAKASPGFDYWNDSGLDAAGFTHDYVSPYLLSATQWAPREGSAAPSGPRYRAILVMPGQRLPTAALDGLLAAARAKVPVIFVGAHPGPLGLDQDPSVFAGKLTALLAMPEVKIVAQNKDAPKALAEMGVTPLITSREPLGLRLVMRRIPTGHYLWLHNSSDGNILQNIKATAARVTEIKLDQGGWSKTTFTKAGKKVAWNVALAPEESRIFWLQNWSLFPLPPSPM